MKILINAISAKQGGILTYTKNLVPALQTRGVEATFAVTKHFPSLPGAQLLHVDASWTNAASRFMWEQTIWRSIVRHQAPDVLFSSANFGLLHHDVPQLLLLREGGLFDPLYLANFTAAQGFSRSVPRWARRRLMLTCAHHSDMVMTPTQALRDRILNWAPDLESRIVANPYGTLETTFQDDKRQRHWRMDGCLQLLFVSIYYPHKNPETLVRALHLLNASGTKAHARITMSLDEIQKTPGGSLDWLLMRQGVEQGLVTTGYQAYETLPSLYQQSDIFVFPSVCETFGHPLVEAMASGIPTVVAEHPVNREICGDAALYFTPFSAENLAAKISLLDANPALREDIATRGRQRVLDHFTWDAHVDRLCELFEHTARKRKKA